MSNVFNCPYLQIQCFSCTKIGRSIFVACNRLSIALWACVCMSMYVHIHIQWKSTFFFFLFFFSEMVQRHEGPCRCSFILEQSTDIFLSVKISTQGNRSFTDDLSWFGIKIHIYSIHSLWLNQTSWLSKGLHFEELMPCLMDSYSLQFIYITFRLKLYWRKE